MMAIVDSAEQSMRDQMKQKWRAEHSATTRQFAESLAKGMDTTVTQMQVCLASQSHFYLHKLSLLVLSLYTAESDACELSLLILLYCV